MWALRRATGRRLWERPWDDELGDDLRLDPNSSDPTRAALGAIAASNAAEPPLAPIRTGRPVASTKYVAARHRKREIVASQTPVMDLRRRTEQARSRSVTRRRQLAALGLVVAVVVLVAAVLGLRLLTPAPQGHVLASTGRPQSIGIAADPDIGSSPAASSATTSPPAADVSAPTSTIVEVTSGDIPGHVLSSISVRWSIIDVGSGVRSQLFEWRTDEGRWVTPRLASSATRTVTLRLPPGHLYSFRVRGTDRAGNVGAFATRQYRI